MSELNLTRFFCGFQVACGVLILTLLTPWIGYHLVHGNFGFIGFVLCSVVWGIAFHLTRLSIREYKTEVRAIKARLNK